MSINLDGILGVSATGNITGTYIFGNGSQLTGIVTSNVDLGNISQNVIPSSNVAYSLGNSTNQWKDLWVSNNTIYLNSIPISLSAGNDLLVNSVPVVLSSNTAPPQSANIATTANIIAGNVVVSNATVGAGVVFADGTVQYTAAGSSNYGDSNVSAYLSSGVNANGFTTNGQISAFGNINAQPGAYFIGNGSFLSGMYGNTQVEAYLPTSTTIISINSNVANTNSNVANNTANIVTLNATVANLATTSSLANTNSNVANLTTSLANTNADIANTNSNVANLTTSLANTNANVANNTSNISTLQGQVYGNANVAAYLPTYTGNLTSGEFSTTGNVVANGNVTGGNFSTAGNILGGGNFSVTGNAQASNISTTGNVSVAGNIVLGGDISAQGNVTAAYFIGDGSQLTNINAANIIGAYGNANVEAYLPTSNTIIAINANIANTNSNVANLTLALANTNSNVSTNANSISQLNLAVAEGANAVANTNANVANLQSQVNALPVINTIPSVYLTAVANGNGQVFSNVILSSYTSNTSMTVFFNGALLENTFYELAGDVLTVNTYLTTGDNIDVITTLASNVNNVTSGYGNSNVALFFNDFAGNINPATDNAYNLGDPANVWATVYANTFIGDGSQLTGINSSGNTIFNGTSNVTIPASNSNITFNVNGQSVGFISDTSVILGNNSGNLGANTILLNGIGLPHNAINNNAFYALPVRSDVGNVSQTLYYNAGTSEVTFAPSMAAFSGIQAPFTGNITSSQMGNWFQASGNVKLPQYTTVPTGTIFTITNSAGSNAAPITLSVFNASTDFIYYPPQYGNTTRSINLYFGQWVQLVSRGTGEWDVVASNMTEVQKVSEYTFNNTPFSLDLMNFRYDGTHTQFSPVSGSFTVSGQTLDMEPGQGPASATFASGTYNAGTWYNLSGVPALTTAGSTSQSFLYATNGTYTRSYRVTFMIVSNANVYITIERLVG